MANLTSSISNLKGVGKTINAKLNKLNLKTISDLIFYLPWRYDFLEEPKKISQLKINENNNVVGEIDLIHNKRSKIKKLNITEALIIDETGTLKVIWFNQPFITRNLKTGDKVSLAGRLVYQNGQTYLASPVYEKVLKHKKYLHTQGIVPFYHLTSQITQKQIRNLANKALKYTIEIEEWIPQEIRKKLNLIELSEALNQIHFPQSLEELKEAKKRLAFGELFTRQLKAQFLKEKLKSRQAPAITFFEEETKKFVESLNFQLTNDQKTVSWQIINDIKEKEPMTRLLEGDVGSGKTLVATIALLNTALNRQKHNITGQGILMVPTEILAHQHFNSLSQDLELFNIKIGLLTSNNKLANFKLPQKKAEKADTIIKEADIIIGTHALIQENVNLKSPALIVIDEEHRFGVEQRHKLVKKSKKEFPHFLSMTATPIPRTLALSIYGDLDLSIIKEMPKGRKEIITKVVKPEYQDKGYKFIEQEVKKGRQAFVVCPLIDPSEKLEASSAKEEYKKLQEKMFPHLKVGLLHGKLKNDKKQKIMQDFLANKINILVSTSVIEVGINIINANLMVIKDSQRFGLAQLHQFRGRVGRGEHQSYCLLFIENEKALNQEKTVKRLEAMTKYNSGFELAEQDLKLRGYGDLLGKVQSGFLELRIASLFDYKLIQEAQTEAQNLIKKDSELKQSPKIEKRILGE